MIISQSLPYLTWQQLLTLLVTLFLENSFFIWLPGHSFLDSPSSMLAAFLSPCSDSSYSWFLRVDIHESFSPLLCLHHGLSDLTWPMNLHTIYHQKLLSSYHPQPLPWTSGSYSIAYSTSLFGRLKASWIAMPQNKLLIFSSHHVVLSQSFFPSKWYLLFWLFMPKNLEWSLAHLFLSLPTSANALSSWFEICPELDYFVTTSTALAQV